MGCLLLSAIGGAIPSDAGGPVECATGIAWLSLDSTPFGTSNTLLTAGTAPAMPVSTLDPVIRGSACVVGPVIGPMVSTTGSATGATGSTIGLVSGPTISTTG